MRPDSATAKPKREGSYLKLIDTYPMRSSTQKAVTCAVLALHRDMPLPFREVQYQYAVREGIVFA